MKVTASVVALSSVLLLNGALVSTERSVIELHGSGTTNPSKCLWLILSQLMDEAKIPVRATYRAVGSSTGQDEFVGEDLGFEPYTDFGAGDIPLSAEKYADLTGAGKEVLHLPFVLGAVSLFHSVPGVPDGTGGLNLTSCLIAKIFLREITIWDHEEILEENAALKGYLPQDNYPIKVARRVKGSSSTASFTEYLQTSCPEVWPVDKVGKEITWPEGTMECEGSGGMSDCIQENEGAIGYIDAGHGHDANLVEIELQNGDKTKFLSSKEAAEEDGIAEAANSLPSDITADADFSSIKLLNQPGNNTWPIVVMSYVYVRKDVTYMGEESASEQSLLVAFLKSLYDPDTIGQCSVFGFTPVPESMITMANAGINSMIVATDAPEWTVEVSTAPGIGQGDYVISKKRRTYAEYERSSLSDELQALGGEDDQSSFERVAELEATIAEMKAKMDDMSRQMGELQQQVVSVNGSADDDDNDGRVNGALALSILSILVLCVGSTFCFVRRWMSKD